MCASCVPSTQGGQKKIVLVPVELESDSVSCHVSIRALCTASRFWNS